MLLCLAQLPRPLASAALLLVLATVATGQTVSPSENGVKLSLNHKTGVYQAGDLLRVSVALDEPAYVYVFYHQTNQQAVLLYPNVAEKDNHLSPGRVLTTPAVGDLVQCRIAAPFGREVVQVVTSPRPIAAFEKAKEVAGEGVPMIPTAMVDQVCQRQTMTHGLAADHVVVKTSDR